MAAPTSNGNLTVHPDLPPIRIDESGSLKVGSGRISIDLIVEHFENGQTPEEIVRGYDTLALPDVYAVIAYYLRHRDEVRAYLRKRQADAEAIRIKIETESPRIGREELLSRRDAGEQVHAPTGN